MGWKFMVTVANWQMQNTSGSTWISQKDIRKRKSDTSKLNISKCLYSRDRRFFPPAFAYIWIVYLFQQSSLFYDGTDVKDENLIKNPATCM